MPISILRVLVIGLCIAFTACSAEKKPQLIQKSNTEVKPTVKLPTVAVRQTLNLSYTQLWTATIAALERRKIGVRAFDQGNGVIESDWTNVTDAMCGTDDPTRAQLNCRVRLKFQLETIADDASGIRGQYEELCAFTEEIRLECPNSKAEKLLLGIIDELRAINDGPESGT